MNFSIILNSRGRPNHLLDLFNSICRNTANLSNIEILVNCDNDDTETLNFINELYHWTPESHLVTSRLSFYFSDRERNLHKSLNHLAKLAAGQYIFVLNDDCELLTQDWDKIAWEALENTGWDIVYGRTEDNSCDKSGHQEYASFPIISKKAVDTLGFFMHEYFVGLGGDVGIYRVYNAIDRIVDVDIIIDHKLHTTVEKVLSPDTTAHEMRQYTYANYVDCFTFDITDDVNRLREVL